MKTLFDQNGVWHFASNGEPMDMLELARSIQELAHQGIGESVDEKPFTFTFNGVEVSTSTNREFWFFGLALELAQETKLARAIDKVVLQGLNDIQRLKIEEDPSDESTVH